MSNIAILPMDEVQTGYYLRVHAVDKPGVLSDVTTILGDLGISIEAIIQKQPDEAATLVPVILLTQKVTEKNMNEAIRKIEALDSVSGKVRRIRVETLA
jgi:homoserine dehydrogenase